MKGLMFCMWRTYRTPLALFAVLLGSIMPWMVMGILSDLATPEFDVLVMIGGLALPIAGIVPMMVVCDTMYQHIHDGVFSMIKLTEAPLYGYVLAQSLLPTASVLIGAACWVAALVERESGVPVVLVVNIIVMGVVINVLIAGICLLWYQISPNIDALSAKVASVLVSAAAIWLSQWTFWQSMGMIDGLVSVLGLAALTVGLVALCGYVFNRRFPRTLTYLQSCPEQNTETSRLVQCDNSNLKAGSSLNMSADGTSESIRSYTLTDASVAETAPAQTGFHEPDDSSHMRSSHSLKKADACIRKPMMHVSTVIKAFWFKELRVFASLDRMAWVSLIFPVIMALNPLFLGAEDALFTAMIDAPALGLLFAITVDYTTWQDYLDGVLELIVQSGAQFHTYLLAKLSIYEAASTILLVLSLLATLYVNRGALPAAGMLAVQVAMACLLNWAWTALDTQLAMFLRLLMPNTTFLLTTCVLTLPVFVSIALWRLLPLIAAALISLAIVLACAGGAFLLSFVMLRRRYASTLGDLNAAVAIHKS